jgi:hypothetical protein
MIVILTPVNKDRSILVFPRANQRQAAGKSLKRLNKKNTGYESADWHDAQREYRDH